MQNRTNRSPLVVLISGRGSNLRALVQAVQAGRLDCELAGVVSNRPDAAGLAWAAAQGLATTIVDHRAFSDREAFDRALADAVDAMTLPAGRPDAVGIQAARTLPWVALAGFMRILGAPFMNRHGGRVVNVHPSLLPLYPGLHTHRQALADGALLHGATVHLVTDRLDHGPILAQAIVPVLAGDTEDVLADRVLTQEHRLYPLALQWLLDGRVRVDGNRVLLDGSDAVPQRILRDPLLGTNPADAAAR